MQSEKDQSNDQGKVMMMMKQNNGNSSNDNSNGNDKAPQKCPRCESLNTKFCYYNNYSLSQPRFFCKTCRRYWTQGGTLRNVPVGGGCRKGKRARIASTTTAISANMASTSSTTSSSEGGGDNSRQVSQAPGAGGGGGAGVVLPRENQTNPQSIIGSGLMRPVEPFGSQFFQGAGSYLPSFADMNNIQSFNHGGGHDDHHNPLSHQLAELITAPSASTLSLLEGFNFAAFGSQQHHQQQQHQHQHQIPPSHQFFDASDHHQTMINNRPVVNSNNNHQWTHPSFGAHVNNDSETTPNHSTVDWTIGAANNSTAGNVHTSTTTSGDVPSNSNHRWPTTHHDLSGSYGPPP